MSGLIRIVGFAAGYGLVYGSFAFGTWLPNPGDWTDSARWMCAVYGLIAGVVGAAVIKDLL